MLTAVFLAVFLPGSGAARCRALRLPATQEGIAEAERLWVKALEAKDTAALACILDDTFSDNSWTGAVRSRGDLIHALQRRTASTIELQDLKTRVEGNVGIATGVSVLHDPAGKSFARARFTDVFVYRDGCWKAIAAQETGLGEAH
jgi:ketosteroid isomerase-like protein